MGHGIAIRRGDFFDAMQAGMCTANAGGPDAVLFAPHTRVPAAKAVGAGESSAHEQLGVE